MARFQAFDREIALATTDISHDAISGHLAAFARAELARVIASGEGSPNYERIVNGRRGEREEAVEAPGPIVYEFAWWQEIIEAALTELRSRSPRRSGKYVKSFLVVAGGRVPVTDYSKIKADAEIIIFNPQPYTRRIETGSMSFSVPPRHFEVTKSVLSRRFSSMFSVQIQFVTVPGGISPLAPYRLQTGRRKGKMLTYPALVINMVQ